MLLHLVVDVYRHPSNIFVDLILYFSYATFSFSTYLHSKIPLLWIYPYYAALRTLLLKLRIA